jgi:protoporphyrin/coproporphyrin ferrochelatase
MTKTAVVFFNLGGPDSKQSIRPFLLNFFTDVNIIRVPYPLRWMIAQLIAWRRSKKEAGDSYGELGDKSPLLANSMEQILATEDLLNASNTGAYKSFVCMRYWHPMADEAARAVADWNPDKIILLPLYPQYSTTTTRSSYQEWMRAVKKIELHVPTKLVCCYPEDNGFVRASADNIRTVYDKAALETGLAPRILMSAHGLPQDIVKDGDPYEWQCRKSAEAMIEATGIENPDWVMCFQSRVGPKKWLEPSTEHELERAAKDGVPVVVLPHAFTQEHVETLVEIEIEYREVADHLGVPGFYRVPTVGTHPDFIRGLADMVLASNNNPAIAPNVGARLCPSGLRRCAMEQFGACQQSCGCGT